MPWLKLAFAKSTYNLILCCGAAVSRFRNLCAIKGIDLCWEFFKPRGNAQSERLGFPRFLVIPW
jgi:hypothetical protein